MKLINAVRGGSWFSPPWNCRSACGEHFKPGNAYFYAGFRLAAPPSLSIASFPMPIMSDVYWEAQFRSPSPPSPMSSSPSITHATLFSLALDHTGAKQADLAALKLRLSACEACADKLTAAAFGYLLAKKELDNGEARETSHKDHPLWQAISKAIADPLLGKDQTTGQIIKEVFMWLKEQHEDDHWGSDFDESIAYGALVYAFPFLKLLP
jgi:hypothetical protein